MIQSILVIADRDSGELTALEKARDLAQPLGAKLHIVRFIQGQTGDSLPETLESAGACLAADLATAFQNITLSYEIVISDDIASWTREACQQQSYDLVIKTGHRSETAFYTPTDWQLIRQLPCAVLIASNLKWRAKPLVLATVDLGDGSAQQDKLNCKVVQTAAKIAAAANEALTVAYTIVVPQTLLELDIVEQESYAAKRRPQAETAMQACLQQAGVTTTHCRIKAGQPDKALPSLANELKADLVVMGSVGRTGLTGMLLGNTAEKVLRNLRTDILVIKPD